MRKAKLWTLILGIPFLAASERNSLRFEDVTETALGATTAFRLQLSKSTAHWAARLDIASGIDFYAVNGIAVGDYNSDGWDDFYVCQPGGLPNRLFRNQGDGTFADVTAESGLGVLDATSSALWLDFRNRGKPDLLLVTSAGVLLFENAGSGRFRKSDARFEIPAGERGSMMMAAAADYDRDGYVDLYICQYSAAGSAMTNLLDQPLPYYDANNGAPNHLFRNNGDGTFTNVTKKVGLDANNSRWSFAAAWADYDADGDPDLYVANDFGRNNLYKNDAGKFRDVAAEARVEDIGPGMSAAWGDYDGDGRLDLYVSNIWSPAGQRLVRHPAARRFAHGNSLYRNRGDGTFESTAVKNGVAKGGWAWGSDFFDADNDGNPDILVLNGHVTGTRGSDLEEFHWTDVVGTSPDRAVRSTRYEASWREFQKRMTEAGWSAHGRERNRLFRNNGAGFDDVSSASGLDFEDDGRSFGILDFDNDGRPDLILKGRTAPQVRLMRNQTANGSHFVDLELSGTRSNRDAIGAKLALTCGATTRIRQVAAGSGFLSQHSRRVHFGLGHCSGPAALRIDWPSGQTQSIGNLPIDRRLRIEEGSEAVDRISNRPEQVLQSNEPATDDDGTWLVDPVAIPLNAGPPGKPQVIHEPGRIAALVIRRLFIVPPDVSQPFSVLLDAQGRAAKIYWRKPDDAQVRRDIGRLGSRVLPFPGQQYGPLGSRLESYFRIAQDCLDAGLDEPALRFFTLAAKLDPRNAAVLSGIGSVQVRQGRLDDALASFTRAAALEPASAAARFNLGTTFARMGRFPEAVANLKQAAEMDPASGEIWANLGNAYLDSQDLQNGRHALERALALDPKSAMLRNSLGTLYAELGVLESAEQHLLEAVRLKPDYEQAYLNLGLLYLHNGKRPQAARMLNECLRLNPQNADARRMLEQAR